MVTDQRVSSFEVKSKAFLMSLLPPVFLPLFDQHLKPTKLKKTEHL